MFAIGNLKAGYGLDTDGYIVSDVSIDKIDSVYFPCIQESIKSLKELSKQLHSVYVYGSVARGEAVEKKSDLDLIAMFNTSLGADKLAEVKKLAGELSQKFRFLVRDVGIAVAYYDYTIDPINYYENAFLKELCVCIYGEDLGNRFGPYKLTSEIAIRFNGDINEALNRTLKRLETASKEDYKIITQSFARKLIRTLYSMVMLRSQIWTTRLYEQAEVSIQHFPEKESMIRTLLKWADDPPVECDAVYELFKTEGKWACVNFLQEAKITLN